MGNPTVHGRRCRRGATPSGLCKNLQKKKILANRFIAQVIFYTV